MRCPICKKELIIGGQEYLETLDEHVLNRDPSLKDKFVCSDLNCISHKFEVCWNSDGERYGGYYKTLKDASNTNPLSSDDYNWEHLPKEAFINQNDSPFGSWSRKMNVEISGVGLKRKIYLSPKLLFNIYQPVIEFHYKSNEEGDVLGRSWRITYLKKDDRIGNSSYCIYVVPFYSMLKFVIKGFLRNKKHFNKTPDIWSAQKIVEFFEEKDDRPYKKTAVFLMKTLFPNIKNKAKVFLVFNKKSPYVK